MRVGPFDQTWFCNERGYNIAEIKPYSAYDVGANEWIIPPPHLPDWGIDKLPEGGQNLLDEAEGYAAVIDAISHMPEPYQTQQGKALWKHLHSDRGRAFSDAGEGWLDPGNLIEKALVEWGLWDKLVEWQYGHRTALLEYFAVKGSDHPLAPDLPQEQHDALTAEPYGEYKRRTLELAKNPVPGTHIWRGELRAGDPVQSARETGVGIHWGVNPDNLVHPQAFEGENQVVYHAELEHPGEQNFTRDHPMWRGHHMSMDSEAEVRLKPGTKVKLHGVWVKDAYHPNPGYFVPRRPERMGEGWSYFPIGEHVPVVHRPTDGLIDYSDVGVKHEGVLGYFTASDEDDDYRMQHRPADEEYGAPLHDLTYGGMYPDDVYTHPHYYSTGEPYDDEAHAIARRVRGKPDAKVKIYRALPAEHAHQGFRPGDWVTTSKEYARLHGSQTDPKHDWPVISTVVPAKHLWTEGNAIAEYGYTGPHKDMPMVSFKGGYHQEIRNDKDGWIKPVKRAEGAHQAEEDTIAGLNEARRTPHASSRPVGVMVRREGDQITGLRLKHHNEDLPRDHLFADTDIPGFGRVHDLSDDPQPVRKHASLIDYFGMAA